MYSFFDIFHLLDSCGDIFLTLHLVQINVNLDQVFYHYENLKKIISHNFTHDRIGVE